MLSKAALKSTKLPVFLSHQEWSKTFFRIMKMFLEAISQFSPCFTKIFLHMCTGFAIDCINFMEIHVKLFVILTISFRTWNVLHVCIILVPIFSGWLSNFGALLTKKNICLDFYCDTSDRRGDIGLLSESFWRSLHFFENDAFHYTCIQFGRWYERVKETLSVFLPSWWL